MVHINRFVLLVTDCGQAPSPPHHALVRPLRAPQVHARGTITPRLSLLKVSYPENSSFLVCRRKEASWSRPVTWTDECHPPRLAPPSCAPYRPRPCQAQRAATSSGPPMCPRAGPRWPPRRRGRRGGLSPARSAASPPG